MEIKQKQKRHRLKMKVAVLSILSLCLMQSMVHADTAVVQAIPMTDAQALAIASGETIPVSGASTAPPEAKITKEQAVEKVKSLFPLLKDLNAENVQLGGNNSYPPQNQNVWNINWQISIGNGSYGFNSSVDSMTGELLQTFINYPQLASNDGYYPPKYSRAEGVELAKAFIQKAAPALALSDLQLLNQSYFSNQALFGPVHYDYYFTVQINGVLSQNESLSISINGNGEVMSYSRNKVNASYPSSLPKVTVQEATYKFDSATELELQYTPAYHNYNSEKDWFLGWAPRIKEDISIDAQSGDFINFAGDSVNPMEFSYNAVPKKDAVFTPAVSSGTDALLTAEKAVELVANIIGIPNDKTLSSRNLNPNWADKNSQVWNLSWMNQNVSNPYAGQDRLNASVDANTGQILRYQTDTFGPPVSKAKDPGESTKQVLTKDAAAEKAIVLINQLYPNASEELKLASANQNAFSKTGASSYTYQFQRFYNDRPVIGDNATISLDASGKLVSYNCMRTANFESAAKLLKATVTKNEATNAYLSNTQEQLQYKVLYSNADFQTPLVKLVYQKAYKDMTNNGTIMDAGDGKLRQTFLGASGNSGQAVEIPKDITKHWANKDLQTMVQFSILKPDAAGLLHPDASVTLGDWMNMFAQASNPQYINQYNYNGSSSTVGFQDVNDKSPYYQAALYFIQSKWLDPKKTPELHPERKLTREEFAESIIHIVKYDRIANILGDKIKLPFKDGDQISHKSAVSLVVQLGLMTGVEGSFMPKAEITKAQAAAVMMKLVYLQGKLDQSIIN